MDKYDFFKKFQQPLLTIANHSLGRYYLGINKEIPKDLEIVSLAPNAYAVNEGNNRHKAIFRTYDLFADKLNSLIKVSSLGIVSLLATHPEFSPMFLFSLAAQSIYSNAAGDGYVNKVSQSTWANAHDAATGDNVLAGATNGVIICQPQADGGWRVDRTFLPFNTSSLGLGTVTGGTVQVMPSGTQDIVSGISTHLVGGTQAAGTALVLADFSTLNATDQAGSVNNASLVINSYTNFALNATGVGNVSLNGYTKFGLRTDHDFSNTACTNAVSNTTQITFYMSDNSTTTQNPLLSVGYPGVAWLGKFH